MFREHFGNNSMNFFYLWRSGDKPRKFHAKLNFYGVMRTVKNSIAVATTTKNTQEHSNTVANLLQTVNDSAVHGRSWAKIWLCNAHFRINEIAETGNYEY